MISPRGPIGGFVRQHAAEKTVSVRKLDPGFYPPFFVEPDHEAGLIVEMFEMSPDPNLRGEIALGPEGAKVALVRTNP